jgi:hypothetical protein
MSLITGLKTGLVTGLKPGLGSVFGGAEVEAFPDNAEDFATLTGNAAVTPSYIWLCDEASGSLVDEIGSEALAPVGGPGYARTITAKGESKAAVELDVTGSTDSFVSSDSSVMDPAATSVAYLYVGTAVTGGAESLFGKGPNGSNTGVHCWLGGTTGYPTARVNDGSTSVTSTVTANAGTGPAMYICVVVNRTTDELTIFSSVGSSDTDSIAAVGSAANASGLYIGRGRFGALEAHCGYFACFEGAAAEAIDQAALDSFWGV